MRTKRIILAATCVFLVVVSASAQSAKFAPLDAPNFERMADAVFKHENSAKWPYGIKVHYKTTTPRQACLNTLRHCYARWLASPMTYSYVEFTADIYCPMKDDPKGNAAWKSDMRRLLK